MAIVGVQFFGLSRGFFRYGERLTSHDAALRLIADLRVDVYGHLEKLAPSGLAEFRNGDLLARFARDVDSLQDLVIRVIPPFAIAMMAGTATVVVMWCLLPAAGLILAVALILSATVVPWLTGVLARHREHRFAECRGRLAESVVDLIDGAPELVAFGASGAQVEAVRSDDAAANRHCRPLRRDGRYGPGPQHPPRRALLLGMPDRGSRRGRLGPASVAPSWR